MSDQPGLVERVIARAGGRRLGLTASALGTLTTNLGGTGLRFLVQLFLTNTLGAAGYGLFSAGRGWGELLSKVPDAGYGMAGIKVLPELQEDEDWAGFKGYVRTASRQTALWGVLLVAAVLAGYLLLVDEPSTTVAVGIALTLPMAGTLLYRTYLQGADQYVLATVITELVQPVVFAAFVGVTLLAVGIGPTTTMVAYVASYLVVVAVQAGLLGRMLPPGVRDATPDVAGAPAWRRLGLRMYPGRLAIAALNIVDLLIVEALAGPRAAGLYAVATRVAVIGRLVNSGLESVVSPRISAAYAQDRIADIQRAVDSTIRTSFLPTIGFAALAVVLDDVILSVFGPEFPEAAPVLWVLLVGNLSNALTGPSGFVVSMTGSETAYSRVMVVHAVALVVGSVLVVGPFGIVGVAAVNSVVTISWNLVLVGMARRRLDVRCYPRPATLRRSREG